MLKTPRSRVKGMLRQIFLRSVERGEAIKRDNYTCQKCGVKASQAKGKEQKVQVHHIRGIQVWDRIIDSIYEQVLCNPVSLITLCPDCHKEEPFNSEEFEEKELRKHNEA